MSSLVSSASCSVLSRENLPSLSSLMSCCLPSPAQRFTAGMLPPKSEKAPRTPLCCLSALLFPCPKQQSSPTMSLQPFHQSVHPSIPSGCMQDSARCPTIHSAVPGAGAPTPPQGALCSCLMKPHPWGKSNCTKVNCCLCTVGPAAKSSRHTFLTQRSGSALSHAALRR